MLGENLPAAQLAQSLPAAENLPAAQLVQSLTASDAAGEDLPAAHSLHVDSADALMVGEYFPAPQSVHACVPAATLNLPAAHAWHLLAPVLPEYPALQRQALAFVLPAGA